MITSGRFDLYRDRIAAFDAKVHGFLHLDLERAADEAAASNVRVQNGNARSPIDGWCVAAKANIAVEGLPHHAGIEAYKDEVAQHDAEVVGRLRRAGAVILGVVNMHEGALGATTDNEAFGRTYNPWGQGLTPGGSSGGSGAVTAAGLCDFALGTDTMGSVRIPSAYCGIYGHKPTPGLVSTDGVIDLSSTLDHVGPHGRSVSVLRTAFSAMTGQSIADEPANVETLRIGKWSGQGQVEVEGAVAAAFDSVCDKLVHSGASLIPFEPPRYAYGKSRRAGLIVSEVEGYTQHAEKLRTHPDGFSDIFRALLEWGNRQPQEKRDGAYNHLEEVEKASMGAFVELDAVIAPTAPQCAFTFDVQPPANQADFTAWANIAGLPACAVYAGLSVDGKPTSLQVIGKRGADDKVLAIAEAIQNLVGQAPRPLGFEGELPGN